MTDNERRYARNRIRYWELSQADLVGWVGYVMEQVESGANFEDVAREVCDDEISSEFYMVLLHVAVAKGLVDYDPKIRELAAMKVTSPIV